MSIVPQILPVERTYDSENGRLRGLCLITTQCKCAVTLSLTNEEPVEAALCFARLVRGSCVYVCRAELITRSRRPPGCSGIVCVMGSFADFTRRFARNDPYTLHHRCPNHVWCEYEVSREFPRRSNTRVNVSEHHTSLINHCMHD